MSKPALCYVVVPGAEPGKRIGIVKRGETGYYLTDYDMPTVSNLAVKEFVAEQNAKLGVEPAEAEAMLYGSCFGWDAPIANAAKWKSG